MREMGFFFFFFQTSVYAFRIFWFLALSLLHLLPVFDESFNAGCYLFHTPPDFAVI